MRLGLPPPSQAPEEETCLSLMYQCHLDSFSRSGPTCTITYKTIGGDVCIGLED